jgi:hypothetical protein
VSYYEWDNWAFEERDVSSEINTVFMRKWRDRYLNLSALPAPMYDRGIIILTPGTGWYNSVASDSYNPMIESYPLWIPPVADTLQVTTMVSPADQFRHSSVLLYVMLVRFTLGGYTSTTERVEFTASDYLTVGKIVQPTITVPPGLRGTVQIFRWEVYVQFGPLVAYFQAVIGDSPYSSTINDNSVGLWRAVI